MINITATEPKFQIGDLVCHIASKIPMAIVGRGIMVYQNDDFEIMYTVSSIHLIGGRHLVLESEIFPWKEN